MNPNDMPDEVPKLRPWEPAIGIRILRTDGVDTLQQMYWRRGISGEFEHEWRDVPIVKGNAKDSKRS
jgi:hypothetical protein